MRPLLKKYLRTSNVVKKSRKTTHEYYWKLKTALRNAYAKNYFATGFASLVRTVEKELSKLKELLSITDFNKLRTYLLQNTDNELTY